VDANVGGRRITRGRDLKSEYRRLRGAASLCGGRPPLRQRLVGRGGAEEVLLRLVRAPVAGHDCHRITAGKGTKRRGHRLRAFGTSSVSTPKSTGRCHNFSLPFGTTNRC